MEVLQGTELTGTNRSCGLVISLRQTSSLSVESDEVRIRNDECFIASMEQGHEQDSACEKQPESADPRNNAFLGFRGPSRSRSASRWGNGSHKFPVMISKRPHPIPSRTRKLSSSEPMVLHG